MAKSKQVILTKAKAMRKFNSLVDVIRKQKNVAFIAYDAAAAIGAAIAFRDFGVLTNDQFNACIDRANDVRNIRFNELEGLGN